MRRVLPLVGAIVFVDTMFFAALTPLLPEYSDDLGLSKAGVGVLAAAYPVGALLAAIPGGIVAARIGVKAAVVGGLAVMAVTTIAFGFADSLWLLDTSRFIQGLASAFAWVAGLSWLMAAAPAERRGELIGTAMAAAIVGALFGPVLGGVATVVGTELAFGAVGVLTAALALWAARTPAFPPGERQPARRVVEALLDRRILAAAWFVTVPALLFGTLNVLAPLRLDELGLAAVLIGATYLLSAGVEAAVSPLIGRYSDRHGRLQPLRIGLLASGVVALLLPWPENPWVLAAVVVAAGISFGSFWAPAMAQLSDRAESRELDYAYAFALVNLAWAPGQVLGAAGGGGLARATSDAVPYLLLAAICGLTLLALIRSPAPSWASAGEG